MRRFRFGNRRGMTLMELIVVLIILSLMATAVAPAMRGPHARNKLRAGARELISMTRYARSAAVLNEARTALEIDVERSRYRVDLSDVKRVRLRRSGDREPPRDEELWRDLPKGIRALAVFSWDDPDEDDGYARIRFYPDGSASDSTIVLENERGGHATVTLNRATAHAEMVFGLPENWDEIEA